MWRWSRIANNERGTDVPFRVSFLKTRKRKRYLSHVLIWYSETSLHCHHAPGNQLLFYLASFNSRLLEHKWSSFTLRLKTVKLIRSIATIGSPGKIRRNYTMLATPTCYTPCGTPQQFSTRPPPSLSLQLHYYHRMRVSHISSFSQYQISPVPPPQHKSPRCVPQYKGLPNSGEKRDNKWECAHPPPSFMMHPVPLKMEPLESS